MKYSDGTPIKASDFTYAIQRLFKADSGGSVFYDVIVGAKEYADGKADTITGIKTDDNTGDITISSDRAQRHVREPSRRSCSPHRFRRARRWTRTPPTTRRRPAARS